MEVHGRIDSNWGCMAILYYWRETFLSVYGRDIRYERVDRRTWPLCGEKQTFIISIGTEVRKSKSWGPEEETLMVFTYFSSVPRSSPIVFTAPLISPPPPLSLIELLSSLPASLHPRLYGCHFPCKLFSFWASWPPQLNRPLLPALHSWVVQLHGLKLNCANRTCPGIYKNSPERKFRVYDRPGPNCTGIPRWACWRGTFVGGINPQVNGYLGGPGAHHPGGKSLDISVGNL